MTHWIRYLTVCCIALGILCSSSFSTSAPLGEITALRVDHPPKLDGVLNDPVWQQAQLVGDFIQQMQKTGEPATERTEFRVIYTDRALYIGATCYDSEPDKVTAHSMARDFSIYSDDVFAVVLDTYFDHSNSFFFCTNANAALYDAQCEQDGNIVNDRWNGVWDCRSTRHSQGFTLEIEIPFSTLRFPDKPEQVWGLNIERDIQRRQEVTTWQPVLPNEFIAAASRCGKLVGLKDIKRGGDIEIKPYGVAGISELNTPTGDGQTTLTKAGVNAKFPVTSRMTVDVTINPDFAQIEDDQAVVNLTRFPLFLSERREFFLESEANFGFNTSSNNPVFYSRRIGLYQGKAVPIIGGVRLVGRTDKYTVGFLDMETDKKYGQPNTNFAVARFKRILPNGSYIGIIGTNKEQPEHFNRTFGSDAHFRFWNANRTIAYGGGGAVAFSHTNNIPNEHNACYRGYLEYPNDRLNAQVSFRRVERNYNPELGYVIRYGDALAGSLVRSWRRQNSWFYSFSVTPVSVTRIWDLDHELESENYSVTPFRVTFNDLSSLQWSVTRAYDRVDYPYPLAGSVVIPVGKFWSTTSSLNFNSNVTRTFFGGFGLEGGDFYAGEYKSYSTYGGFRVDPHFSFDCSYKLTEIDFDDGKANTIEVTSGAAYAFSTHWQTTLYSQWNNEDKNLGLNYRLHWIPSAGNDVYLAYNNRITTEDKLKSEESTVLLKAVYRFVI
ncbi:MAG: carbohydrate binding family 9 domain-containing protein [bacterium]|nr:carbohydrate binding family 9 domain-containing protein [bacterium]